MQGKNIDLPPLPSTRAIWTIWHPKDTKSGPPPGVVGSPGTLWTPSVVPQLGAPSDFSSIFARNVSGMHENQHNLINMTQNFDASPAVTKGMPQDPYFGPFRVETAKSAAWGASPLNPPRHKSSVYATACVSSLLCKITLSTNTCKDAFKSHCDDD